MHIRASILTLLVLISFAVLPAAAQAGKEAVTTVTITNGSTQPLQAVVILPSGEQTPEVSVAPGSEGKLVIRNPEGSSPVVSFMNTLNISLGGKPAIAFNLQVDVSFGPSPDTNNVMAVTISTAGEAGGSCDYTTRDGRHEERNGQAEGLAWITINGCPQ